MANNDNYEIRSPLYGSTTGGLAYSAATLVYAVVIMILSGIVSAAHIENGTDAFVYISYIASPIALGLASALVLKLRKTPLSSVFCVKCKIKYYFIAAMLAFGLLFSLGWVNGVCVEFFKLFGYVQRSDESYFPDLTGGMIVPALLIMAILPAFAEETFFRGIILKTAEQGLGSVRAVFVIGFCFALFHSSPEQTVYQFICGCIYAFLAVRAGSPLPGMLAHFFNNALIIIFAACNMLNENGELIISEGGNIALITLSACCLAGALVWLILDKTPLKKCVKGGLATFFLYAAAGIFVLALEWILLLFGVGA